MITYVGGSFDFFHSGHVNFLRQCAKLGEVVVALNSDEFIDEYKGKHLMSYEERKKVLEGCRYVYKVVPHLTGQDSKPTIIKVKPDIIAIGSDWAGKDYYKQMSFTQEWLDELEILLIYLPYTLEISSTKLKKRCQEL